MTDRQSPEHNDPREPARDAESESSRDGSGISSDEQADNDDSDSAVEGLTEWGNLPSDDQTWTAHSSPLRQALAWGCLVMLALGVLAMIVLALAGRAMP